MIFKEKSTPSQKHPEQKLRMNKIRIKVVCRVIMCYGLRMFMHLILQICNFYFKVLIFANSDSLLRNETVSGGAPDEFRLAQSQKAKNSAFKELFLSPASFKPFVLLLLLFVLMQSTGTFAIIFYAVNVFQGNKLISYFFIVLEQI